ncbi:MAG: choice-of-anchor D domain-containing protein, partial [bacterium]
MPPRLLQPLRPRTGPRLPALLAGLLCMGASQASADVLRVAIVGDYGIDEPVEGAVADLIDSWDPDAVFTVGDNSYDNARLDDNVGKYYGHYIGNYKGGYGPGETLNRFFPTLGNHDYDDGGGVNAYLNYFTLPGAGIQTTNTSGTETYYDVVIGPVHFFALDSNGQQPDGTSPGSVQGRWLQSRLAESSSPWKVVYFHHSPYSSGSHGGETRMRWPFGEWGADAVIAGHDHDYERLMIDDTAYFVNGAGGRSLRSFRIAPIAGSAVRYNAAHGAMLITADPSAITFEFQSVVGGGTLVDSYTIEGAAVFPEIAVAPASLDFEVMDPDSSAGRTLVLRSVGTTTLQVASTALLDGGAGFSIAGGGAPLALAPGDSAEVLLSLSPLGLGSFSDTLRIESNDADDPTVDVPLSGSAASEEQHILFAPHTLTFDAVRLGTDRWDVVRIANGGLLDLRVLGVGIEGADAADFSVYAPPLPLSLAAGQPVFVAVRFAPTAAGPRSATLVVQSDDPDRSAVRVSLAGSGVQPPPGGPVRFEGSVRGTAVASASVTSGILLGVSADLYLAAISSKELVPVTGVTGLGATWSPLRSQCGGRGQSEVEVWIGEGATTHGTIQATLAAPSEAAAIVVARYSGGSASGRLGAVLSENTNGPAGPCTGGVDGSHYALDLATTRPNSVLFGAVAMRERIHSPGPGWTARNEARADGAGSVVSVAVADRSVATPADVALDGSFDADADWSVVAVEIRGALGDAPEILVTPGAFDFGVIDVGEAFTTTVQIRNDGTSELAVDTEWIGADATEFSFASSVGPLTLAPGRSANLGVRFAPTSAGPKTITLRVTSNDTDEGTVDVALAGKGHVRRPRIVLAPAQVDFGSVLLGETASAALTVRNDGDADLHASTAMIEGPQASEFTIDAGGGVFSLPPGETRTIEVSFRPGSTGAKFAELRVASNDPDVPVASAALGGRGIVPPAPDIALGGTYVEFGAVHVGAATAQTIAVRNEGDADL